MVLSACTVTVRVASAVIWIVSSAIPELWQVITEQAEGRKSDRQVTLFDSVGFAIEDFSALRYVRDQLEATGLYQELDLLADPDEPRDLFGMLLRAASSDKLAAVSA